MTHHIALRFDQCPRLLRLHTQAIIPDPAPRLELSIFGLSTSFCGDYYAEVWIPPTTLACLHQYRSARPLVPVLLRRPPHLTPAQSVAGLAT